VFVPFVCSPNRGQRGAQWSILRRRIRSISCNKWQTQHKSIASLRAAEIGGVGQCKAWIISFLFCTKNKLEIDYFQWAKLILKLNPKRIKLASAISKFLSNIKSQDCELWNWGSCLSKVPDTDPASQRDRIQILLLKGTGYRSSFSKGTGFRSCLSKGPDSDPATQRHLSDPASQRDRIQIMLLKGTRSGSCFWKRSDPDPAFETNLFFFLPKPISSMIGPLQKVRMH
jgi:hypothetical protein